MKVPINQFLHQLRATHKRDHSAKVVFLSIGNPESKYAGTRHNAGHRVLQAVASRLGGLSNKRTTPGVTLGSLGAQNNVYFAQSNEFMNTSGKALQAVLRAVYGENVSVIVVHDDMSLDPGEVKFKLPSKSFGGHNGLRDLARYGEFPRLRIGIGSPPSMDSGSVSKYVLGKFTLLQRDAVDTTGVDQATQNVQSILGVFETEMRATL